MRAPLPESFCIAFKSEGTLVVHTSSAGFIILVKLAVVGFETGHSCPLDPSNGLLGGKILNLFCRPILRHPLWDFHHPCSDHGDGLLPRAGGLCL